MPIYEYYSPDTHKVYSFLARSLSEGEKTPRCPDGDDKRMERVMSQFAYLKGRGEDAQPGDENMTGDDLRMEAALGQLEKEFQGMDEENPDPRQMGAMMRRMQEITGQKLPGSMQEMMGRLEAGEDPDALEEMFGDDLEDEMGDYAEDRHDAQTTASRLRAILREARQRQPAKDPELYELKDWL
ncbi:MAG: cytochrome C [Opitutales bacterium]